MLAQPSEALKRIGLKIILLFDNFNSLAFRLISQREMCYRAHTLGQVIALDYYRVSDKISDTVKNISLKNIFLTVFLQSSENF